jgi:2-alkyl-3-oxoalkanoate reductase
VDGHVGAFHEAREAAPVVERAFDQVNRDGAAAVAEAALNAGIGRFVLISSIAARSPLVSAYAASKRAGEAEVLKRLEGRVTILRPPVVYGPGDRETLPMFRAARWGVFLIPGPREARLSFIHVADFAAAVSACLSAREQPVGAHEPDDGRPGGYGWPDIIAAFASVFGHAPRPVQIPAPLLRALARVSLTAARARGRPHMLRPDKVNELRHPDWVCRDSRLGEIAGWRAQYGLAEGFRHTADWYRAHGWLK